MALSTGVFELDRCGFEVTRGCSDSLEARRLAPRSGQHVVDYLRSDGTVAACDLAESKIVPPVIEARQAIEAQPRVARAEAAAWIDGGAVRLAPGGGRPERLLRIRSQPLGLAMSDDGRTLAVSDRDGIVSLFSVPDGMLVHQIAAHARNAYAVAFDSVNRRVVSVAGPGQLAVLNRSAPALARRRSTP